MSVSRQNRTMKYGILLSLTFHLVLLFSLTLDSSAGYTGRFGNEIGQGTSPGISSAPAQQGNRLAEVRLIDPISIVELVTVRKRGVTRGRDDTLAKLDTRKPNPANDSTIFLRAELALAGGSGPEGGITATSPGGGDSSSGGDPLADGELLAQIAKCLPANVRPTLKLANLALEIGSEGELRVAPRVEGALPLLSAEDRLVADQTVQAALQCGPYDKPNFRNRVFALVADFSILPSEIETSSQGIGAQAASPPRP